MVQVVKTIAGLRPLRSKLREQKAKVTLVPTMGALHAGHLSLVQQAKKISDYVLVSIFVNPTQFGPDEDFQDYPRDLNRDLSLLEESGVGLVFIPEVAEIYPAGFQTYVAVEELSQKLCGISRPSHFRGVTTVVLKLFNIVQPESAAFGQKDAQQVVIIRRMLKDLNLDVELITCPIVREPDGLALSSRNRYLNEAERKAAIILYQCLQWAKQRVEQGEACSEGILQGIKGSIEREPLARLDYAEIVDAENLSGKALVEKNSLLALAVFIGKTRLIDNMVL